MLTYLHPQLIPLCVLSGFIYFKNNRHLLHVQSAHFRPPASSLVHPSETTKLALSTEDQTMRQEHPEGLSFKCGGINTIWNRTRPRALVQNQHMRELTEDVPPVEFMPFVFTRVSGESYHWQLRSFLLRLCDIFRVLVNSLVCWCSKIGVRCLCFVVVLYLCRAWFADLTWERVYVWEELWNVHNWWRLIVVRWPSVVERTW